MKSRSTAILAATLILVAAGVDARTQLDTTAIDQAVISKLSAQFGINSKVIQHGDCGVSTFLFAYDRKADSFRVVFFSVEISIRPH